MTFGPKRLTTVFAGLALAATIGIVPSSPAQAEPDIDDVQTRVDTLYRDAEQASERYNDAKLELDRLEDGLGSLQSDEKRQGRAVESVRDDVRDSVIRQYTGSTLSGVGQVVSSVDPQDFMSEVSTMSSFNAIQNGLFADYSTQLKALDLRRAATEKRRDQLADIEKQLADEKATVDDKLSEAKSLLGRLEDEQREAMLSRGTTDRTSTTTSTTTSSVPASGRAAAAVQYAMAQVGKAYVYGAAGPSAFDCSGLTMMAWAQAGVSLPHSSSAQYASGTKVAESDLQPGDLVFYYSPISHVGMYIGNGQIVNALNPGAGVNVSPLHMMPYVGAVRPG